MTETGPSFGSDRQFDGVTLAPFRIKPGATLDELSRDLYTVEQSCAKSDERHVAHLVAELMARTKLRVQGEGEARLLAETMVSDLRAYPLDVAEFACEYWVSGGAENKFFPSWPELKDICDRRMSGRLRLRKALNYMIAEATK